MERETVQGAVVAALQTGEALPGRPGGVEVRETHISYVFLTATHAYKLKKAVVLPFVDYGTAERRRHMCEEEVRLNRRLAPSIYLGVRAVVPHAGGFGLGDADDPAAVEHVVEMRRFEADSTLAARLGKGEVDEDDVDAVAQRLARFHRELPPAATGGDPLTTLRSSADETFRTLHELAPPAHESLLAAGDRFTRAFLSVRGSEIAARARAGLVREGHGDLRAEHVLLDGGVQVFDCVEFDPALRTVDVGADLAFLVMDLEHLGRPDAARRLLSAYVAHGGDPGAADLVAFHAAQRASVRAKVALLQARAEDALALLHLARRLAWRARGAFALVVCGLSGSGKTTLARELAGLSGIEVVSSDPVRKRLAGLEPADRARPEHYTEDFNLRTYGELGRLARERIDAGRGVIVDATFRRRADRRPFVEALGKAPTELRFIECVAPRETLIERSAVRARRREDASDATPDVVREQSFDWLAEAHPGHHAIMRTDRPPRAIAEDLEAWLDGRL
jgi:aminoglycoside phosphotransferase family enzyme/predicted kinase